MRRSLILLLCACAESVATPAVDAGPPPADGGALPDAGPAHDASVVLLPGDGSSPETAAISCEALAEEGGVSGLTWINPHGGSVDNAFAVLCDLDAEDGPWTLVARIDGSQPTFGYSQPVWINETPINPGQPANVGGEHKNRGFWELPYGAIRLRMRRPEQSSLGQSVVLPLSGQSLRHTMVMGETQPTELGREAWRSLVPESSLQPHCNEEGLHVQARLRIGLLGNNEENCDTPDSYIGVGGWHHAVIAGNFAVGRWEADNGDARIATFAELWVRAP